MEQDEGGERSRSPRFQVIEDEGRRAMLVDGVVVSVAVEDGCAPSGYWTAMLPLGTPRNALLLGLGGGTLAHILAACYPGIRIVGVDADAEVVEFAREHFGLALPGLSVVVADAFGYVAGYRGGFDFIAVDLFRGYDFQRRAVGRPFLNGLKRMLERGPSGGGEAAFNLFKDRRTAQHINRIARVLPIRRIDHVFRNVVVHCRLGRGLV